MSKDYPRLEQYPKTLVVRTTRQKEPVEWPPIVNMDRIVFSSQFLSRRFFFVFQPFRFFVFQPFRLPFLVLRRNLASWSTFRTEKYGADYIEKPLRMDNFVAQKQIWIDGARRVQQHDTDCI
jgi:hypothetical protein